MAQYRYKAFNAEGAALEGVVSAQSEREAARQLERRGLSVVAVRTVEAGALRPSTDLPTHAALYDAFPGVGGVVHTHSRWATAMAQAECDLPCYGTTHADYFYGTVPCTRSLTAAEIREAYERNTGLVIAETFRTRGIDPLAVPAALVRKHGPFAWAATPEKAVENALVLDECAHMALLTCQYAPDAAPAPQEILDKHYLRKHGAGAYYGQK